MPKFKTLTPKRRENLKRLADYLETLPRRYAHFDMQRFTGNMDNEEAYALRNGGVENQGCGAVACAVGHGPSAGILFKASQFTGYWPSPDWHAYTIANFTGGERSKLDDEIYCHRVLFAWLFGEYWQEIDNHPWGAAARIRYLLDGKPLTQDLLDAREGECWTPSKADRRLYTSYRKG